VSTIVRAPDGPFGARFPPRYCSVYLGAPFAL
jgi:hypothetical protein